MALGLKIRIDVLRIRPRGTRQGGIADTGGRGVGGRTERASEGFTVGEGTARGRGVAAEELPSERRGRRVLLRAVDGGGGPNGGEREEDGDEGQDVGAHFGDIGEVLQDGEDGWKGRLVSWRYERWRCGVCIVCVSHVPGMTRVWQPMMKMICIGPNRLSPNFRLAFKASPSFATKMTQKKQMLVDAVILVALPSHSNDEKFCAARMYFEFSTTKAKRNPTASRAMEIEHPRMQWRWISLKVTHTTCVWRTSDSSRQIRSISVSTFPAIEVAYGECGTRE